MSSKKWLLGGALVLAATFAAAQAEAHGSVQWSVSVGTPVLGAVFAAPAPVYATPVYGSVYSAPVYGGYGGYGGYRDAPAYRGGYHQPTRWDVDGDGIPNRYDRVYNPRWDRDGDGIPNRYDHRRGPGRY